MGRGSTPPQDSVHGQLRQAFAAGDGQPRQALATGAVAGGGAGPALGPVPPSVVEPRARSAHSESIAQVQHDEFLARFARSSTAPAAAIPAAPQPLGAGAPADAAAAAAALSASATGHAPLLRLPELPHGASAPVPGSAAAGASAMGDAAAGSSASQQQEQQQQVTGFAAKEWPSLARLRGLLAPDVPRPSEITGARMPARSKGRAVPQSPQFPPCQGRRPKGCAVSTLLRACEVCWVQASACSASRLTAPCTPTLSSHPHHPAPTCLPPPCDTVPRLAPQLSRRRSRTAAPNRPKRSSLTALAWSRRAHS